MQRRVISGEPVNAPTPSASIFVSADIRIAGPVSDKTLTRSITTLNARKYFDDSVFFFLKELTNSDCESPARISEKQVYTCTERTKDDK